MVTALAFTAFILLGSSQATDLAALATRCALGHGDEALIACRSAIEGGLVESGIAFPDSEVFFLRVTQELMARGRFDDALRMYRPGVKVAPRSAELNYRLGKLLLDRYDAPAEAFGPLQQATRIKPRWLEAQLERARAESGMGRKEDARETLAQAVMLNPRSWETRLDYARALLAVHHYRQARVQAEAAVRLMPESYPARLALADSLEAIGRHTEAVVTLEQAIRMAPDDWYPYCRLARILAAMGRTKSAHDKCIESLNKRPSPKSRPPCECTAS